jgi:hypothetical protein
MRIYFLIIYLVYNISFSQERTIEVNFDQNIYDLTAHDTIARIISRQKALKLTDKLDAVIYLDNTPGNQVYLANHYNLNQLKLISIPIFRINRLAYFNYDSGKNLEKFITFAERLKYQYTLIFNDSRYLCSLTIPDIEDEKDRIYSGSDFLLGEENHYVNRLFFYEKLKSKTFEKIQERPKNLYFLIFGLENYLFDIDSETGLIYAQCLDTDGGVIYDGETAEHQKEIIDNLKNRIPLNEYIRKNNLVKTIKQIALGFYGDYDDPTIIPVENNQNSIPENIKVIIKKASH